MLRRANLPLLKKLPFSWNSGERRLKSSAALSSAYITSAQAANRRARVALAAAYRGLDKLGLNEGVCNHLTLRAPAANGEGEVMLLIPYGLHWSEVTASSLIGLDENNAVIEGDGPSEISAASIHRGIHNARSEDVSCVMHTHMPYATALSVLQDPTLRMCHQNSLRFYENISYDTDYQGLAENVDEGDRMAKALGKNDAMIMRSHGVMVVGPTVASAFDTIYYLERACQVQVMAMWTGEPLVEIEEEMCKKSKAVIDCIKDEYSRAYFDSMLRRLRKECPDFEN
ncbi:uncharacterized protein LOC106157575 isoform X1 [Lingula anatina]|uniref:Uncharacterized protein LOC106157575 isoform X1 n=1 Tax=Lingula anatina TaxID=7574 RepID=A0A1S3HUI9_LINAN|nr:uncharacterized protein LOC106157575 isoform X1 [Lingula anatina]XP_013388725.1 uncharacterized protein LOC106157575 isoform X1 [Lingula anatina]XP_013388726.1 uncharacterized protein LOC106157575 isoform X1 [Lingula anatina]XP_013388728.1 uncharacterized protein LOC106157575 isoform X1 [Lingula anatina]|eukprot:XP_013388724.1 uncharacterized protein LOC106157575 isoform X1 [Lingula anatina]